MTLEKRLQKRLQRWLQEARKRRLVQSGGAEGEHDQEWWLNQSALEMLEKCVNELTADLCAVSDPEPKPNE